MPEPVRRKRPVTRTRDVYTEADGLFGRLTDVVIENPVRSGGVVLIAMVLGAIVSNAAFLQTAHHPDPFFVTRPPAASAPAATVPPARTSASEPAPAAPTAPVAEAANTDPLPGLPPEAAAPSPAAVPLPKSRAASANGKAVVSKVGAPRATAVKTVPATSATASAAPANIIADTQRALAAAKFYDGPIDGMMGPQTKAAISSFEMRIGLIPTGQPSPHLLEQMRKGLSGAQSSADPISTGSIDDPATRARLKRVQSALNDIGYGPIPVDGRGGGKTATAIRRFELDNGLPISGQATDTVVAKLVMIGAMK
ncbi:peptidoglycan-binding protein [Kaistia dalseonensis]|uniref:Peptidoglycan hydrolase-like protein with peptidoglycan-binding domain n=1 Tax=Kaistia dalseonensis TaxID=410840 RepID=A0ABU0HEU4_9HYPH|nr:peptidoglycan-binding protein [Kaistia dalseonensis]MCX5497618.1 peptidoglycan-binding protein [Kaistia dalseonensis]MDQ0440260.1 peptidoglycan hydrolase-like protein with peptidoglycan-binding domain [Kaistia dalseonensis]